MASYTPFLEYAASPDIDTDTTLISSFSDNRIISSFVIANSGSSSASVEMYLADSVGNKLASILSGYSVGTGRSQTLDVNSLNLPATYQIIVNSDGANVDFIASGVRISATYTGDAESVIEEYTEAAKALIDLYIEDVSKPSIDDYVENTSKPEIDAYVNDALGEAVESAEASATAAATSETNAAASATAAAESEARVEDRVAAYEVESTDYLINSFDGNVLEVGDVVRTLGYYTAGDGGGAEWVKTSETGTASQSPSDNGDSTLTDSNGIIFDYCQSGYSVLQQFGFADDDSNQDGVVQAAFSTRDVLIDVDVKVSSGLTILHPCNIVGSRGASITITNAGGLSGESVINITLDETESGFLETSVIEGVNIYTLNDDAYSAVKTNDDPYDSGSVFQINRPRYIFKNMFISGATRVGGGAFTYSSEAFYRAFEIKDSDGVKVESVNISGNLVDTADMSVEPQLTAKENTAIYIGGDGAVYKTTIDDCSIMHSGCAVRFGAKTSNPRIVNSQFARCYHGIYCDLDLSTEDAVSELQLSDLNLNCVRTPISFDSTDFLQINNVRCSRSSDYDTSDVDDWCGLEIGEYCRSLLVNNFRGFISDGSSYSNNFYGLRVKSARDATISNIYGRVDSNNWQSLVKLINPETAVISNVVDEGGVDVAIVELDADEDKLISNPRVSFSNIRSDSSVYSDVYVNTDELNSLYINGEIPTMSSTETLSESNDGETINIIKGVSDKYMRYAATGSGTDYECNINFNSNYARGGDKTYLWMQFNSSAGTNPTINFQIDGSTFATISGTSELKRYSIEMVHNGSVWFPINFNRLDY